MTVVKITTNSITINFQSNYNSPNESENNITQLFAITLTDSLNESYVVEYTISKSGNLTFTNLTKDNCYIISLFELNNCSEGIDNVTSSRNVTCAGILSSLEVETYLGM